MKKVLAAVAVILQVGLVVAQIPDDYYQEAKGLTGIALKDALHNIIDDHVDFPYTSSSTDVWDILKESDRDPNNPDNVILFYTGWSVNAAQEYNSGSGWSREHVWAKSRGDFNTSRPMGTDCHNLRAADVSVNSARNNRWFDEADTEYIDGGVPTANYTSSSSWVWEPREAVKGDVARMMFYMVTRYEGGGNEVDLELIDSIPDDNNTLLPIHAKLSTLLSWHFNDPVDSTEQHRNEIVFQYQQNRNPFIDHPDFVALIWGDTCESAIEFVSDSKHALNKEGFLDFSGVDQTDDGTFTGENELLWKYQQATSKMLSTGEKGVVLAHNSPITSHIEVDEIPNGCGRLSFDFIQFSTIPAHFQVLVNQQLVLEIDTNRQNEMISLNDIIVEQSGMIELKIEQSGTGSGEVWLGNISWTDFGLSESETFGTASVETFDNFSTTNELQSGTFEGHRKLNWIYKNARNACGYNISGNGIILSSQVAQDGLKTTVSHGVKSIYFDAKRGNSVPDVDVAVEVYIDAQLVYSSDTIKDDQIHSFEIENINLVDELEVEFRSGNHHQVVLDNIRIEDFDLSIGFSENRKENTGFLLYPNPSNDLVTLKFSTDRNEHTISIVNLMGEDVFFQQFEGNEILLDLRELSSGYYFVKSHGKTQKLLIE